MGTRNYETAVSLKIVADIVIVIGLTISIVIIDRNIKKKILDLRNL